MAAETPLFQLTYVAGADLSGAQFHFVKFGATEDEVVLCDAVTDDPIGVLQNNPAEGEEATVMHAGRSKVVAGSALTYGDPVGTDANGEAEPKVIGTDTTEFVAGRVREGVQATNIGSALINCLNAFRAA